MDNIKILIVDDEEQMIMLLSSYLEQKGFEIHTASDGKEVLKVWEQDAFDLILLDIMMPGLDGFSVCERIREVSNVPIMMITAKSEELNRVHGLNIGADDYIVKPFSPKELVARVEALLRRSNNYRQQQMSMKKGELVVDINGHKVSVASQPVNLTRKEFRLLTLLMENEGVVFSREKLLDKIWGMESAGTLRTVDTHIKTLRLKLDSAGAYVKTVWGVGYKFEE
ncbi:response regulator transcription factor [Gracilibacillus salinarum]|uniref:Response regulator transcription factor n=1 Tax=Gracilibacillus salinarum TaxID=2932255 RepID=A0ABY4GJA5_9BACI|nr:response regulator transcription factor [Gracilibacillus salinarum]UOQ84080.1 response regulator transcription factor [Gracilibacillus salinarum]